MQAQDLSKCEVVLRWLRTCHVNVKVKVQILLLTKKKYKGQCGSIYLSTIVRFERKKQGLLIAFKSTTIQLCKFIKLRYY
jgi:hypothetical protein